MPVSFMGVTTMRGFMQQCEFIFSQPFISTAVKRAQDAA